MVTAGRTKMSLTEQQRLIAFTVVARFINLRETTSRKELLRKFKDKDAIDELLNKSFFNCPQQGVYSPLPIAFEYCGDTELLKQGRGATELALAVLQNLDEAHPGRQNAEFTTEEFIDQAGRICDPKPDKEILMLGLSLSTHFGIFRHWAGDPPTSFGFHENIVTIDPASAWEEQVEKYDPAAKAPARPALNLPWADFDESAMLHAPVRPVGDYLYHPEIKRVSEKLWLETNFRQAVLDAFIHVIATVKERTRLTDKNGVLLDGDHLMNRAFCPDNQTPAVQFNPLRTDADKDEQRGIWNLFKGVVGLRNFKAHIVKEFDDPHRAHEYLALASLLMRLLDLATYNLTEPPPQPTQARTHLNTKTSKRDMFVEIYGEGDGLGTIFISGSESSTQPGTMALSRRVTIVNKGIQPVRIMAQRLVIKGSQWPVEALFFQNLRSRAKQKAITVAGNAHDDYRIYFLVSTTNMPKNETGIVEFQIDENEVPLRVAVQFAQFN